MAEPGAAAGGVPPSARPVAPRYKVTGAPQGVSWVGWRNTHEAAQDLGDPSEIERRVQPLDQAEDVAASAGFCRELVRIPPSLAVMVHDDDFAGGAAILEGTARALRLVQPPSRAPSAREPSRSSRPRAVARPLGRIRPSLVAPVWDHRRPRRDRCRPSPISLLTRVMPIRDRCAGRGQGRAGAQRRAGAKRDEPLWRAWRRREE